MRQVSLTVVQLSSMVLEFSGAAAQSRHGTSPAPSALPLTRPPAADKWTETMQSVFLWQQAASMSPATSIPVQCFFSADSSVMAQ